MKKLEITTSHTTTSKHVSIISACDGSTITLFDSYDKALEFAQEYVPAFPRSFVSDYGQTVDVMPLEAFYELREEFELCYLLSIEYKSKEAMREFFITKEDCPQYLLDLC